MIYIGIKSIGSIVVLIKIYIEIFVLYRCLSIQEGKHLVLYTELEIKD